MLRLDDYRRLQDHTIRRRLEDNRSVFHRRGMGGGQAVAVFGMGRSVDAGDGRQGRPSYRLRPWWRGRFLSAICRVACQVADRGGRLRSASRSDRVGRSSRATGLAGGGHRRLPARRPRRDQRSREPWRHLPIGGCARCRGSAAGAIGSRPALSTECAGIDGRGAHGALRSGRNRGRQDLDVPQGNRVHLDRLDSRSLGAI